MNKIRNIAVWAGILGYFFLALSFTGEIRRNTICSKVKVEIRDSLLDRFMTKETILDYIHDLDMKVLGEPVVNINTGQLESYLNEKENIRKSDVYFTANGNLHVIIDQRNPILRVINQKGQSYYIDGEGAIVPLSGNYSSHVLVATGEITESFEVARAKWLNCPGKIKPGMDLTICEIYQLARFIHNDPFWDAQIEQIYVNRNGEYELIPRVGAHLILFGGYENYHEKFRNLKAFYKNGLNNLGWNQYLIINLKYDNQIICTKNGHYGSQG
jgi:cell division protein FtsQ